MTLSWVVRHGLWGTSGLPLLAMLYVRQKDLKRIVPWYKVKFQTKLQRERRWPTERRKRCEAWAKCCGSWPMRPMPSDRFCSVP